MWELCPVIRARFRKEISWLQYPIPWAKDKDGKDVDPHTPSTRALELNSDALHAMLNYYTYEFVQVHSLQKEAGRVLVLLVCAGLT